MPIFFSAFLFYFEQQKKEKNKAPSMSFAVTLNFNYLPMLVMYIPFLKFFFLHSLTRSDMRSSNANFLVNLFSMQHVQQKLINFLKYFNQKQR